MTELARAIDLPEPEERTRDAHPLRLCVIDLGTNSFHGVIVDAYPNRSFTVLDKIKEAVQLGEHGGDRGPLTPEGVERAVAALQRIKLVADGWKVGDFLAYATSAIREADNGAELIEEVRRRVGLHVRPIPGELEADLIFRGVRRAVSMPEPALVVDIGGGSTELVVGSSEAITLARSFKVGAARMTHRFVSTDPISDDEIAALRGYLEDTLAPVLEVARAEGVRDLVGASGTMENLVDACVRASGDSSRDAEEQVLEAKKMRKVLRDLIGAKRSRRASNKAIDGKRVDQVVAGAILLDVLLERLPIERIRISPNALREGMVLHYLEEHCERLERLAPLADVRRRQVEERAIHFRWEEAHSRHVTRMALFLFDACEPLHGYGEKERELLELAGLMHDIGYAISRKKHHKHGRYLIESADWQGFRTEEVGIIASLVRYHRRAFPKKKHRGYGGLSKKDRKVVDKLAPFLRLAEGLDRSHYQNVRRLEMSVDDERARIRIHTRSDPEVELWGARRAAPLFEHVYDREVEIEAAGGA